MCKIVINPLPHRAFANRADPGQAALVSGSVLCILSEIVVSLNNSWGFEHFEHNILANIG